MSKKKFSILKVKLGIAAPSLLRRELRRLRNLEDFKIGEFGHRSQLYTRLSLLSLQHLGFTSTVDAKEIIDSGIKIWKNYFNGDWWRGTDIECGHTDKSRIKDVCWHEEFLMGLTIASLATRTTAIEKVCKWVESALRHEYAGEEFDYERPVIYKLIAQAYNKVPMAGIDREVKRMKRQGGERTLALFDLVSTIALKDSQAFGSALAKSLKSFQPITGRGSMAINWVALEETVLVRLAVKSGLRLPELPENLEALIMTRNSVGL